MYIFNVKCCLNEDGLRSICQLYVTLICDTGLCQEKGQNERFPTGVMLPSQPIRAGADQSAVTTPESFELGNEW